MRQASSLVRNIWRAVGFVFALHVSLFLLLLGLVWCLLRVTGGVDMVGCVQISFVLLLLGEGSMNGMKLFGRPVPPCERAS